MEFEGSVYSAELCAPLYNVQIKCFNLSKNIISQTNSDKNGKWKFQKTEDCYQIEFSCTGFLSKMYQDFDKLPPVIRLIEDNLIGYQDKLWFLPGEMISLYVSSSIDYTAKLYRHGIDKKCILDLGLHHAETQQVPDTFFVENGLSWQPSLHYKIPDDALPGIYSLLLEAKNQESFAVPMIISTPDRLKGKKAKLLVLASTNNWQSYNLWGGRSRYRNFEDNVSIDFIEEFSLKHKVKNIVSKILPGSVKTFLRNILGQKKQQQWMFKKLSIHRPFTNCALEEKTPFKPFTNHLAAGEWRLLAWFERENIAYDMVSMYELHNNSELLQHYSGIILTTHSEYWSKEMYVGIKKHHEENGLWILNISGNTMYREVEFLEDGSTRCVSLSFMNSCEDETKLLGVRFDDSDYSTCAPYKILEPDHWAFSGIPINNKYPIFGTASLNQNTSKRHSRYDPGRPGVENGLVGMGASGWETDKLSKTAGNDFLTIAKGLNKNGGADMVIREPEGNRGGVFSASSIAFGASLLIDNIASEMAKNILKRVLESDSKVKHA